MKQRTLSDINLLDIGNTIQITGAIWSGNNQNYLVVLPGEHLDSEEFVLLKMDLADWEKFLRQTDLLETEILESGPEGSSAAIRAIVRKSQRQIDSHLQWKVFQRDSYSCRYCGVTGIPLTVDHLILWEKGGPTIFANLLSACKPCNRARGSMEYGEWLQGAYYLRAAKNLSLFNIEQNEALVESIKSLGRVNHIRSR